MTPVVTLPVLALGAFALLLSPVLAQGKASAQGNANSPFNGFGGSGKDPIKIDANRLEVQQQANKATYTGDVVAVQGKMTMRCTTLHVFFNQQKNQGEKATPAAAPAAPSPGGGGFKRLECLGPVTVTQEKQTATSAMLVYEADTITMTGNVVLSDGDNVQAGEKMVYHTKTQIGQMEGGRVRGIFTPGSDQKPGAKPKKT